MRGERAAARSAPGAHAERFIRAGRRRSYVAGKDGGAAPGGKDGASTRMMINIDCKAVRIRVPAGDGSGAKARAARYGVLAISRMDGVLISLTQARPGLDTGPSALRAALPSLGIMSKMLEDPDTPPGERIIVNADRGMRAIKKVWPGADVRIPRGGRPWAVDPASRSAKRDRRTISRRAAIERAFRGIDAYRLVGETFDGTVDEFDTNLNIVSGLVNLKAMMAGKKAPGGDLGAGRGEEGSAGTLPRKGKAAKVQGTGAAPARRRAPGRAG